MTRLVKGKDLPVLYLAVGGYSDGAGGSWKDAENDDEYFREAIAEEYMRRLGTNSYTMRYTLQQLPSGYSGWVKNRDQQATRCTHGHPAGRFNTTLDITDHFEYLQRRSVQGESCAPCVCWRCRKLKKRETRTRTQEEKNDLIQVQEQLQEASGLGSIQENISVGYAAQRKIERETAAAQSAYGQQPVPASADEHSQAQNYGFGEQSAIPASDSIPYEYDQNTNAQPQGNINSPPPAQYGLGPEGFIQYENPDAYYKPPPGPYDLWCPDCDRVHNYTRPCSEFR
ncbi:Hypothetical predicted protein [Lecanosticta acicola]|uniref:Cryptic loci regulator 2 N-terminal domain-containing protein n=1 Tax=Lecanosticta acicola TaxID=111012 RepID=A0AAI9EFI8_9PEZI|nr:Hypothetical predicted protein [Lecanosticta acicola]